MSGACLCPIRGRVGVVLGGRRWEPPHLTSYYACRGCVSSEHQGGDSWSPEISIGLTQGRETLINKYLNWTAPLASLHSSRVTRSCICHRPVTTRLQFFAAALCLGGTTIRVGVCACFLLVVVYRRPRGGWTLVFRPSITSHWESPRPGVCRQEISPRQIAVAIAILILETIISVASQSVS